MSQPIANYRPALGKLLALALILYLLLAIAGSSVSGQQIQPSARNGHFNERD